MNAKEARELADESVRYKKAAPLKKYLERVAQVASYGGYSVPIVVDDEHDPNGIAAGLEDMGYKVKLSIVGKEEPANLIMVQW